MQYSIYTDGGCSGNRRDTNCPGAWAYLVLDVGNNIISECSAIEQNTTNNRMEMQAVIEGLSDLTTLYPSYLTDCIVFTDSRYVADNFSDYIEEWKNNKWRKKTGGPIINLELWQQIYEKSKQFRTFKFVWVKAHASNKFNQRVDELVHNHLYPDRRIHGIKKP